MNKADGTLRLLTIPRMCSSVSDISRVLPGSHAPAKMTSLLSLIPVAAFWSAQTVINTSSRKVVCNKIRSFSFKYNLQILPHAGQKQQPNNLSFRELIGNKYWPLENSRFHSLTRLFPIYPCPITGSLRCFRKAPLSVSILLILTDQNTDVKSLPRPW